MKQKQYTTMCIVHSTMRDATTPYTKRSCYTQDTYNVPLNSCSLSIASNKALKFPLPKEVAPFR